jgi:hypothetical protein
MVRASHPDHGGGTAGVSVTKPDDSAYASTSDADRCIHQGHPEYAFVE